MNMYDQYIKKRKKYKVSPERYKLIKVRAFTCKFVPQKVFKTVDKHLVY